MGALGQRIHVGGGIVFEDFRLAYVVGSLALAVILFDGGLRTRVSSFRGVLAPALLLSTVGVVLTAAVTGAVAALVLDLRLVEGLLVGAIVASTDAAAVFFLMRSKGVQLRRRVANTIEIESATNDPVAVFLTLVLVELVLAPRSTGGLEVAAILAQQGLVGAAIGISGGLALALVLNRVSLPQGLHPLLVVAAAVLIFALASVLESRENPAFHPVPRATANGFAVDLGKDAAARRLVREILHVRMPYEAAHLKRIAESHVNGTPDIVAARAVHLDRVRAETRRADFGRAA